jgi:hypothetical protein
LLVVDAVPDKDARNPMTSMVAIPAA